MDTSPAGPPLASTFPVVGVGASAGGLEAFTRLLRHLPARPGLALLLVQHLDPSRDSLLGEILSRETAIPVRVAADGMPVAADHVYVIPPDARMGVEAGVIRLQPRGGHAAPHHPVDFLFRSLAAEYGPRAVAVVLSGGGTDGTLGLGDVREAGGVTFAQDEGSAVQVGMPASAAASGNVDVVLAPEGIAASLTRLAGQPGFGRPPGADPTDSLAGEAVLGPLFAILRAHAGIDFGAYKQNTIRRRVGRRMALRDLATVEDLVRAVRDDPPERATLHHDLLIGVTRFFRDPDVFDRLRRVVPTLLQGRTPDAPLRVWVPGCSTGEEAYSLAVVLAEALGESAEVPVKILATDVNEESLTHARSGVYSESIAADVSPERLRRFFRKVAGGYRVSPAVRDLCVFARHDLSADPPFARMDLVSCRNVLIYFDAALQRRVLPMFHYALRPGGHLLLGPSETVGTFADLFAPTGTDDRLYTRTLSPGRPTAGLWAGVPAWGRSPAVPVPGGPPHATGGLSDVQREADRVLSRYAPAGVLIDDNLNVLQFRGDTDPYLRHPPGTAGLDVPRMARPGLLPDLRDGVAAARAGGSAIRRPGVRVGEGDAARTVTLHITPLAGGGPGLPCFLVVFEGDDGVRPDPPVAAAEPAEEVRQLRRELDAGRERQQAVAEEYEAANEELKSANEEILASNEELQSTNEELQTAKEEMQSANEELATVNEELAHRNRELGRANDDLQSLLVGVNVPVVVVGRDLRIRRLTAQAEEAFGLLAADAGRPLRDVRFGLDVPDIGGTVARVIGTLEAAAFEARDRHGRWHAVRVRPYETGDNRIDGAVLTAHDIDAAKRADEARRDLEAKMFQAQKLESLGVMAGGVAHDLNNLLTPVVGYTDLAREALPGGSPALAHLDEVARHTRQAVAVVQQLLSYSGKRHREVGTADLSRLVRDLDHLLARAAAAHADLRLELAAGPLPVEVDAVQVAQVVMNLVTNGAEAVTAGRGAVTVRTELVHADRAALSSPHMEESELPEGPYAALEVSDTGGGMSAETLARMFDPFYTTKFTGRGLGLAAVLGIVRGHRGSIRVRSEPGRGTTVRVLLPLSNAPVPAAPAPAGDGPAGWAGSGTVLLVEDDPPVRRLASLILQRAGFVVLDAADGVEGLDVFRAHAADVRAVVTDLTMSRMGGLELAAALRAERPSLPILVISGYSAEDAADHLPGLHISGFVQKPFAPGSLVAAMKKALAPTAADDS